MTSVALGAGTSPVEVTNISQHGFWQLLADEELFLPFAEFPWFRDAVVGKISGCLTTRDGPAVMDEFYPIRNGRH